MTELELVRRIERGLRAPGRKARTKGLLLGIGDDAAVLDLARSGDCVISCDFFIEGAHFLYRLHPPDSVGYKSLARATSDLAAMGARPAFFFLGLALPGNKLGAWLNSFLLGMRRASRDFGLTLAGGDTARHSRVIIHVTVLGETRLYPVVERGGARPGDWIYVSGRLGAAALGLHLVRRRLDRHRLSRPFIQAHLYPKIRLELGRWLARSRVATAMIDLSDGLSSDLAHICEASRVGARIWSAKIPCVSIPRPVQTRGVDPVKLALHGGEDYELAFTVPPKLVHRLVHAPGSGSLRRIGEITEEREVVLVDPQGRSKPLSPGGWDPFRPGGRSS